MCESWCGCYHNVVAWLVNLCTRVRSIKVLHIGLPGDATVSRWHKDHLQRLYKLFVLRCPARRLERQQYADCMFEYSEAQRVVRMTTQSRLRTSERDDNCLPIWSAHSDLIHIPAWRNTRTPTNGT